MRSAALALLLALSAAPAFAFTAGVLEPVAAPVAAEAGRLGLLTAAKVPKGAAAESAVVASSAPGATERMADWSRLRFLLWRAAAKGAPGVWFTLPSGDPLVYPEEWQALARVARELQIARPIFDGEVAPPPFAAPPGLLVRSWTRAGRRYALLVNDSASPAPIPTEALTPWRALFAVRADARQVLPPCGVARCLPPEGVLWLEGRLGSGVPR